MELHDVEKQKMEAVKALASLNMQTSEAKVRLSEIKEQESEYFAARDSETMKRISAIVDESQKVLVDAHDNYEEINKLASATSDFVAFLIETSGKIESLWNTFEEYSEEWEQKVSNDEERLSELRKLIHIDKVNLKNDRAALVRKEKALNDMECELLDRRGVLERALKRLKNGKI